MHNQEMLKFFERDKFAKFIGIELQDVGVGTAKARLELNENHMNGVGVVHGGAIYTLADLAFAAAVNSKGRVAVAINCTISYIKAPKGKFITAEAWEVAENHTLASFSINVSDENGEVIAVFSGMAYKKKDKVEAKQEFPA